MESLRKLQHDFGQTITIPIEFETGQFEFNMKKYPESIDQLILPQMGKNSRERILTYHKQYWFRLLTLIQEQFPTLDGYLNSWNLNKIAVDYLTEFPSKHWSLSYLADHFIPFLQSSSTWNDPINIQICQIDEIYRQLFLEKGLEQSPQLEPDRLPSNPKLQNSIRFYKEDWDILNYRKQIQLNEKNTGKKQLTSQTQYYVLYKLNHHIHSEVIIKPQYLLLKSILENGNLERGIEIHSESLEETELSYLFANLSDWFKIWAQKNWFTESNNNINKKEHQ